MIKLYLLWVPNFIVLEIFFIFGTKFSWNEEIDTCFNVKYVLLGPNFNCLSGYCSLPSGYCWLLLVTWWLLLILTFSMNGWTVELTDSQNQEMSIWTFVLSLVSQLIQVVFRYVGSTCLLNVEDSTFSSFPSAPNNVYSFKMFYSGTEAMKVTNWVPDDVYSPVPDGSLRGGEGVVIAWLGCWNLPKFIKEIGPF